MKKILLYVPALVYRTIGNAFIKWKITDQFGLVVWYKEGDGPRVLGRIRDIKRTVDFAMLDNEAYQINMLVRALAKIPGDIAEVGVYQGGSAILMGDNKGTKSLHLFDTYEGLPNLTDKDKDPGTKFYAGQYACSLQQVQHNLAGIPNVFFYQGIFPQDTGHEVGDRRFSLVHIDVDLYQATKDTLEFFYPRMSPGGMMVTHDYGKVGVRRAYDEFLANKPEIAFELSVFQGCIVKL